MNIIQYEKIQLEEATKWIDENWGSVPHSVRSVFNNGVKWRKEYIEKSENREEGNQSEYFGITIK